MCLDRVFCMYHCYSQHVCIGFHNIDLKWSEILSRFPLKARIFNHEIDIIPTFNFLQLAFVEAASRSAWNVYKKINLTNPFELEKILKLWQGDIPLPYASILLTCGWTESLVCWISTISMLTSITIVTIWRDKQNFQ